MRNAAFLFLLVAFGYAAKAQRFTLLPQVGFENSKTKISYNNQDAFSPLGVKFSPQASLRLNYSSKKGHGFFIGAATSRSIVSFGFADPETANTNYTATTGNMQVHLEGGYQFSSKAIPLGKPKASSTNTTEKKSCGYHSHCCSRGSNKSQPSSQSKNNTSWLKIQPSAGMAYVPGVRSNVTAKTVNGQGVYEYNAGNMTTAIVTGVGFEFGKGSTRQFTVSVNYFKGLGNLNDETITSVSSGKNVTTTLSSATSGWNVRIGIPFSLKSNPQAKAGKKQQQYHRSGCGQYRMMYRCHGLN